MFLLVDANAFYCSAEQVFRPDWRGKAVIVLSNNDGCIVAANKLAIAAGIKKFEPYFKVADLCKQKGIIVCSSNYELYADLSSKMMHIIARFAPEQHIYSIDECFLAFPAHIDNNELLTIAQQIRLAVWKETRLAVSVGLGQTLTLAKVANHAAKKLVEYQGVCLIDQQCNQRDIFNRLSLSDVWGVGRKTAQKLKLEQVNNINQLAALSPKRAQQHFSVDIERTIRELNGQACINWDTNRADKQQIFSTRSVGQRITDIDSLQQALSKHTAIACAKARQQGSLCCTLMAFASSSPFDKQPRSFKIVKHFTPPCSDTGVLIKAINDDIHALFQADVRYYKIGVGLISLVSARQQQLDLFNQRNNDPAVMNVLDNINKKYGRDTLFHASQGINPKWVMRRAFLSPQYTTHWRDIPLIHC